jgi:hypothetical protein
MHTLKFFREHYGWIGLITLNPDKKAWGFKVYYKPDYKALSVISTNYSTHDDAEKACIEYISKQLLKTN